MSATPVFAGGGRSLAMAGGLGLVGLLACLGLSPLAPRAAAFGYLVAFAFWVGSALGALGWLMIFHAAHARWMVVVRRLLEGLALTIVPLALLFVPIAFFLPHLYAWAARGPTDPTTAHIVGHQRLYLNPPFFFARAAFYLGAWVALAALLARWSSRQDQSQASDATGATGLLARQRLLGAGGLPLLGFSMSFASFDWIMSLQPGWASTIFGLYFIAGGLLGGLALLILCVVAADRRGPLRGRLTASHYHSLGKLLFAFVCFWAYIAFSQLLLVWIGNLPDEMPWYYVRIKSGWAATGIVLAVGHFALPFLLLLSSDLKRRPLRLAAAAGWLLAMHYLDLYWAIMPRLHPEGPRPSLFDPAALVGLGGLCLAFGLFWLRGRPALPVHDPYLAESLRYQKS